MIWEFSSTVLNSILLSVSLGSCVSLGNKRGTFLTNFVSEKQPNFNNFIKACNFSVTSCCSLLYKLSSWLLLQLWPNVQHVHAGPCLMQHLRSFVVVKANPFQPIIGFREFLSSSCWRSLIFEFLLFGLKRWKKTSSGQVRVDIGCVKSAADTMGILFGHQMNIKCKEKAGCSFNRSVKTGLGYNTGRGKGQLSAAARAFYTVFWTRLDGRSGRVGAVMRDNLFSIFNTNFKQFNSRCGLWCSASKFSKHSDFFAFCNEMKSSSMFKTRMSVFRDSAKISGVRSRWL